MKSESFQVNKGGQRRQVAYLIVINLENFQVSKGGQRRQVAYLVLGKYEIV